MSSSHSSSDDGRNPGQKSQLLESQFQSAVTVEDSDREELASVNHHLHQGVEDTENGSIDDEFVNVEEDDRRESSDREERNAVEEAGDGSGAEGFEGSSRNSELEVPESEVVNVKDDGRRESSYQEEMNAVNEDGDGNRVEGLDLELEVEAQASGVANVEERNAVEEGADGGGGFVWRRTNSEVDVEAEAPASPSSSGYAGERGSSSGTSGSRRDGEASEDEILEVGNDGGIDDVLDSPAEWTPGKRHVNEDDASISWRKRKKHFFVLSNSGKPIYSRYGDEHKLAGFSATLQAIISFVENGYFRIPLERNPIFQVVFLVKGPIYLVCISCTEELYESLNGQLELLYGQMILILTKSLNRCFEKNPKFDMTPLLRGTDDVDTYLIFLTTRSDAFFHLKDCRIRVETVLLESNVLSEVQRSVIDGGMRVEDLSGDPLLRSGSTSRVGQDNIPVQTPERIPGSGVVGMGGPAGLWHFLYRSAYLDQYVSSEFSSPINTRQQQKRLYRAYQKLYVSMHSKGTGPHKTQFRRDESYVLLCWVTPDFELYAAFDPLADKALAIKTCNKVCQWVKDVENEIFLMGANPFSW
ncbi:Vacuolar fusion protein MON1 homolog [Linum grandiflorum]